MKKILGRLDVIGGTVRDHHIGHDSKDPEKAPKAPEKVSEVDVHKTVGDTAHPLGGAQ